MTVKKCYPNGKTKAFNITYDDGVLQDVRFVALLNRYGLKGTFNLNSELMKQEFSWKHPSGLEVKRLPVDKAMILYRGHEIASHTLTHPYMQDLPRGEVLRQLGEDKKALERIFGTEVAGFAVPFTYYSDLIARCAEECGFEYARKSEFSHSYEPCRDYYHWKTGVSHLEPEWVDFVDGFLRTDVELAVCQIVGHSYDLETEGLWDTMESVLRKIKADGTVWSATNLELVRYLKAMEQAAVTEDSIQNHSGVNLWFRVGGEVIMLRPGEHRVL